MSTGGPWSLEEKKLHINCLELLAGSFAIKTFTKTRGCAHDKLLLDNASAVAYINKRGGTHSQNLSNLAINLWEWCFQHQLLVSAQHLPGNLNVREDQESRAINDSSDWKLNPTVFQTLSKMLVPFQVDLFASRLTHQLPIFASWKPDPLTANIDAFSVDWGNIQGYTFPPFALIGRYLRQPIQVQDVDHLVLVAPVWPTQSWYPLLLQMSIDLPVLIPPSPQLFSNSELLHPLTNLQLPGWRLSAKTVKHQIFQKKLERFCWQPGDKVYSSAWSK